MHLQNRLLIFIDIYIILLFPNGYVKFRVVCARFQRNFGWVRMVLDGFGWFQVVSGGFGWLQVVLEMFSGGLLF